MQLINRVILAQIYKSFYFIHLNLRQSTLTSNHMIVRSSLNVSKRFINHYYTYKFYCILNKIWFVRTLHIIKHYFSSDIKTKKNIYMCYMYFIKCIIDTIKLLLMIKKYLI